MNHPFLTKSNKDECDHDLTRQYVETQYINKGYDVEIWQVQCNTCHVSWIENVEKLREVQK